MQTLKTTQNNVDTLPLKELVDFSLGGDWGKNPDEKLEDYVKVKVIRGTEFANWWKHKANTAALRQIKKTSFEKRQLKSGDLVVEVSGGGPNQPVGRVIAIDDDVIANSDYPLVCSNFSRQIRLKKDYVPAFVRLSIYFDYLSGKLDNYQTSSTNLRNLNFNDFLSNIEVPFLPKEEQRSVASKLENAIDTINLTKAKLASSKSLVKKFRQAVLSAAITGKLTEDWRANNKITSVDDLLNSIGSLRRKAQGVRTKIPLPIAETDLPDIPETWRWVSVDTLSNIVVDGVHKKPNYIDEGVPFITIRNLTAGQGISFDQCRYISENDHQAFTVRAKPERGDLLISKDGTLGVVRAIRTDREFSIFVSVAMIKPVLYEMSDYLELALSSPQVQIQMVGVGSGLVHLVLRDLKADGIPVPPLEEQKEIVKKVNQYLEVANQVEKQIEKAEKGVGKLTQAILAKTFNQE